jgi:hypothetical protein
MAVKQFQQGLLFGLNARKNVFDLPGGNIVVCLNFDFDDLLEYF